MLEIVLDFSFQFQVEFLQAGHDGVFTASGSLNKNLISLFPAEKAALAAATGAQGEQEEEGQGNEEEVQDVQEAGEAGGEPAVAVEVDVHAGQGDDDQEEEDDEEDPEEEEDYDPEEEEYLNKFINKGGVVRLGRIV